MIYVLVVCVGVSVMGCGWVSRTEFPTAVECSASLARMRIEPQRDGGSLVAAWCAPKAP